MIDWAKLQTQLPNIGTLLGELMADRVRSDLLTDENGKLLVIPSVAIGYHDSDGTLFRLILSIEFDDAAESGRG